MYKTYSSYRDAWQKAYEETPPVPLNVDLELASTCNLRCPFCFIPDPKFEEFISQKIEDGKPLRRLMPKELAFKIIDQCADMGVPALKFNWRGESTLHPEYSEIVKYARSKRRIYSIDGGDVFSAAAANAPAFIELLANTNANCSDKTIDGLMATTKCMISLDSMVPETYAQMRVGGKLERAKEVISELVREGHPNIWVRRVLSKTNYKENFFESVKNEWGDKVNVSQHYCFDRNAKSNHEISGCDHDDKQTKRRYCGYPSQRLVISSTGKVYPCCIDLHETMPVGDISKQSINEIWNSDVLRNLRTSLRSLDTKTWSDTCRNCESWMSWDAPQRDFVQDVKILESQGVSEK